MRYFRTLIKSTAEKIKTNAKINLRAYEYDNPICAVNQFVFSVIDKGMTFLIYEETERGLETVFSFDEKVKNLESAYSAILNILKENIGINKADNCPVEISMLDFNSCCDEAHRRGNYRNSIRFAKQCRNLAYEYDFNDIDRDGYRFRFDEATIPESESFKKNYIMDSTMSDEISRIRASKKVKGVADSKIHYVISAESFGVGRDITMRIMSELYDAGRLSGKRIELFSEINPVNLHKEGWIDKIIENSYEGVVVFDLSTRFGREVSDYTLASDYIIKMVKKYHKHCTFVFTYNTSAPGFANFVLEELTNYITIVPVREGRGDVNATSNYIKGKLEGTEYSGYAKHISEFMSTNNDALYSQSEAEAMYDKFIRWIDKTKKLSMYSDCTLTDFRVINTIEHESAIEELDNMIGLEPVKKIIYRMMDNAVVDRKRQEMTGKKNTSSMHMIFYGVPGTAKSTVANLVGRIAKEKDILQSGVFVSCNGSNICPESLHDAFVGAKGGVLFIDEAYAMGPGSLVTLLQEMEERRDEVIVILAGYKGAMHEFLGRNEGLKSRIPHMVEFPSYSADELTEIFKYMLDRMGMTATSEATEIASELFAKARVKSDFGNGRYVREFITETKANMSSRLIKKYGDADSIPEAELTIITEDDIDVPNGIVKRGTEKGNALKEFEELIGLATPKEMINRAIKRYKAQKIFKDRGLPSGNPTMHMVFTGNPGTAKTTVARYFGKVMREEGLLSTGEFVAASRADIVIPVPGASARRVRELFEAAKGGILFVDEAYSLGDNCAISDEVINTFIEEMENHREDLVVIFAGYPNEMKAFIELNPGMKSRIANYVHFEDYSSEELIEITKLIIKGMKLNITCEAEQRLAPIFEEARKTAGFGNGRYARTLAENARDNLFCRVADMDSETVTEEQLTTILPEDITVPVSDIAVNSKSYKIGFAS